MAMVQVKVAKFRLRLIHVAAENGFVERSSIFCFKQIHCLYK